jgi:hypothetical protein
MAENKLSPLAELLLRYHREEPDRPQFRRDVLGSLYREKDLDTLIAAYRELEDAGLVVRSGKVVNIFGHFLPYYTLAEGAGAAR